MIVDVTMCSSHAVIENKDENLCIHVPLLAPLKSRMMGRQQAKFHADMVGRSLELGEQVDARYKTGPAR